MLHVIYVCPSCCYMKMFPGENKELKIELLSVHSFHVVGFARQCSKC